MKDNNDSTPLSVMPKEGRKCIECGIWLSTELLKMLPGESGDAAVAKFWYDCLTAVPAVDYEGSLHPEDVRLLQEENRLRGYFSEPKKRAAKAVEDMHVNLVHLFGTGPPSSQATNGPVTYQGWDSWLKPMASVTNPWFPRPSLADDHTLCTLILQVGQALPLPARRVHREHAHAPRGRQ